MNQRLRAARLEADDQEGPPGRKPEAARAKRPCALDKRLEAKRLDFAERRGRADDDLPAEFAHAEDVTQRSASSRTPARPRLATRLCEHGGGSYPARPARASGAAPFRPSQQGRETQGLVAPRHRRCRSGAHCAASPSSPARYTANAPSRAASKRISASTSPSGRRPCASKTKLNFAGNRRRSSSSASRFSSAARLGPRSSKASGSRSSRGLATMFRKRSTSGSASMSSASSRRACRSVRVLSLKPRRWRLARAVRPIMPLPQRIAASASAAA